MKTKICKVCGISIGEKSKSLLCEVCYSRNYMNTHKQEAINYRCNHREIMRKHDRDRYHKDIDTSRKNGREKAKKHRQEHPDLVREVLQKCYYKDLSASRKRAREYSRKQRVEHLKIVRASARKWAHKHYYEDIEQSRTNARLWWHKDIEENKMKHRLRRHNNKIKVNEKKRNNYRKDIEKSRERGRIERLKRRFLTRKLIKEVYERNIIENGVLTCYLCKLPIAYQGKNLEYKELGRDNLEHKIPICRGGIHALDNMDVAHALCNLSKGWKTCQECLEQHIVFPPKLLKEVA